MDSESDVAAIATATPRNKETWFGSVNDPDGANMTQVMLKGAKYRFKD